MPFDLSSIQDYWFWLVVSLVVAVLIMSTAFVDLLPFLVGTLATTLVAFVTSLGMGVQLTVFVAVSIVAFLAFRPFSQRIAKGLPGQFGVDRLVGRSGVVTEPIDWKENSGHVRIGQEEWPARSADEVVFPKGSAVVVTKVEGNRLFVESDSEANL